jgi:hypothetical protein
MPQRNVQFAGDNGEDGTNRLLPVDVLVRIEVGWIPAQQTAVGTELEISLAFQGSDIVHGSYLIQGFPIPVPVSPFPQIEMKAGAESGMLMAVSGGGGGGRPAHHQTGTSHNTLLMGFDDAPIHAGA